LADCGEAVGFYESDGLVSVSMYGSWREAWDNWPRSLPMRDQYFGWREAMGLLFVLLAQALPLPAFILGLLLGSPAGFLFFSAAFVLVRIAILCGVARAYRDRPWTYWLSPLCDLPVAVKLLRSTLMRRHSWRGRSYMRRPDGGFQPVESTK
jgi:dolichol-phosphate mannosyltransferase